MDSSQFRSAAHATIEDIITYFDTLPSRQVTPAIEPGYLAPRLPTEPPEHPEPWHAVQKDIENHIMPGLTHWQSPHFMAFFPAMVTFPSILGEMYSAAFTAPAFNWTCSPACTELETVVLDWMAKAFALPEQFLSTGKSGGGGVIQGSASEAIVTCMVAARERWIREAMEKEGLGLEVKGREQEKEDRAAALRGALVALGSEQAHSSTQKAAIINGVRYRSITATASSSHGLTGPALLQKLEECKAAGLAPFYLTVTLGTTGTCAIDDFEAIAAVKAQWEADGNGPIWIHVDAAYAGAALICPEYQSHTRFFASFDSFNMNMHKWLLVNFDASLLFVAQRSHLTRALSITPSYLQNRFSDTGLVTDYRDWQIPLGRRFRALKIWFVLRSYGLEAMRGLIRRHITLGEQFGEWIRSRPDVFIVIAGPRFALNVFAIRPKQSSKILQSNGSDVAHISGQDLSPDSEEQQAVNKVTKEVYERINGQGQIFLTSSLINGIYTIRIVSANERTEEKYLRQAFKILVEVAEEVRGPIAQD